MKRLPIVGVMGSGVRSHEGLAVPLGRRLAGLPVHLLTGGGGGVMGSVSRAFAGVEEREGLVIGVLPRPEEGPEAGTGAGVAAGTTAGAAAGTTAGAAAGTAAGTESGRANPWVEVVVRTHLGTAGAALDSRNHVNVLTSDVVVALPGSVGTASEVELSVRYGRPVILFGDLERARTFPPEVATAATVDDVVAFVRKHLPDTP